MSTTAPEPISPFSATEAAYSARSLPVRCQVVSSERERSLHLEIRHEIFVRGEGLFEETDRDEHDRAPETQHILGLCGPTAAGAVRIYPLEEPGMWKGDRLAVLPEYRSHRLGPRLVRFAVQTAGEAGGSAMIAYVLPQNVRLFERLDWYPVGEQVTYVGQPHQRMRIDFAGAGS